MDANTYYLHQHLLTEAAYARCHEVHEERMNEYRRGIWANHDKLVAAVTTYLEDNGDLAAVARIIVAQAAMGDFALPESQAIVNAAVEYDAKYNGPDWMGPDELADEQAATEAESNDE